MNEKNYVAGFMFSPERNFVVLIKKNKPDFQRGKFNGVGGKIEEYDKTPLDAMIREFKEETGVTHEFWHKFCELNFRGGVVHFFKTECPYYHTVETKTDEYVGVYPVDKVLSLNDTLIMSNLKWLIPMALDKDNVTGTIYDLS